MSCSGRYTGSNVNGGWNAGSFFLLCGNMRIDGQMWGKNEGWTTLNLQYDGILAPLKGEKGEQGIAGLNGVDGANGINGADGLNGTNGVNGLQGAKGDKGDTGATGSQGIQGIAGTNATVDLSGIFTRLNALESFKNSVLTFFFDFANWYNSPQQCMNGAMRCIGNSTQRCINYVWAVPTSCQFGCNNGVCNNPPIVCTQGAKQCSGNMTQSCNNNAWVNGTNCQSGCNSGICNVPIQQTQCNAGYTFVGYMVGCDKFNNVATNGNTRYQKNVCTSSWNGGTCFTPNF